MELIEIITYSGQPTGIIKPRSQVVYGKDWHFSVQVRIFNSAGHFLIQKRSKEKKKSAGKWDMSVCGHIQAGEEPLQAALREVQEEIGLELGSEDLEYYNQIRMPEYSTLQHVYYAVVDKKVEDFTPQAEELDEVQWISFADLTEQLQAYPELFLIKSEEYQQIKEYLQRKNW